MNTTPQYIGPFQILETLGQGGMGVVYRVAHPQVQRPLALKLVLPHARDSDMILRFEREATLLARVKHPNVIQVHQFAHSDQGPYLVTEYAEGESLEDRLRRGGFEPKRAAKFLVGLARAVHAIHDAGVIHRDLKPDNVFVRPDGSPLVLDFGLARADDVEKLTQTGALMGTLSYMAPEQAEGVSSKYLDGRTDVYALGGILFHMLTGNPPVLTGSQIETLRRIIEEDPPFPTRVEDRDLRTLWAICRQAMGRRPRDRYATAAEMADDLESFLRDEPASKRRCGPLEHQDARWPRVLAGALGVGALVALGVWGTRAAPAPEPQPPALRIEEVPERVFANTLELRGQVEDDGKVVVVRVGERTVRARPGETWTVQLALHPGTNALTIEAEDDDGLQAEPRALQIRCTPAPDWYVALPDDARPSFPLPTGLQFVPRREGEYLWEPDGSILVYVPPGSFVMGNPVWQPGEGKFDGPPRQVELTQGFFLGKYEVTHKQFSRFLETTGYAWEPLEIPGYTPQDDHPITAVTHKDAVAYCGAYGLRLPSEAEWEYAALGGRAQLYPWGDEPSEGEHANLQGRHDGYEHPAPVGSFPLGVSRWGALDMVGNVGEWTRDLMRPNTEYPPGAQTDPVQRSGTWAQSRGGAFGWPHNNTWGTFRWAAPTELRHSEAKRSDYGFRVALSAR